MITRRDRKEQAMKARAGDWLVIKGAHVDQAGQHGADPITRPAATE
jgi:hypothetical protein